MGGQLVTELVPGDDARSIAAVITRDVTSGETTRHETDAVVFAVGVTAMQKLVTACPVLAQRQEFRNVMNLRAIDVIATRCVQRGGERGEGNGSRT